MFMYVGTVFCCCYSARVCLLIFVYFFFIYYSVFLLLSLSVSPFLLFCLSVSLFLFSILICLLLSVSVTPSLLLCLFCYLLCHCMPLPPSFSVYLSHSFSFPFWSIYLFYLSLSPPSPLLFPPFTSTRFLSPPLPLFHINLTYLPAPLLLHILSPLTRKWAYMSKCNSLAYRPKKAKEVKKRFVGSSPIFIAFA